MTIEVTPFARGNRNPQAVVTIDRQDIARYAGASGDYNLVHVDETFAREAGHDSVIAMGMLTAGIAGSFVNRWLGVENVTDFGVRFEAIVYPDDELTYTAEVTDESDERLEATFEATNQGGDVVLTGTTTATVP